MLLVLNGKNHKGEQQSLFTENEQDLALHVAKRWNKRGWHPYLLSKTFDGVFAVLFDGRKSPHTKKAA